MKNALPQLLVTPKQAADWITSGASLAIAADHEQLEALPVGNWIGGTIPYFMGQDGGITSREAVFVTPMPKIAGCSPRVRQYDRATLSQICVSAPDNGYTLVILPAFSDVHMEYARNAALYEDMFLKPVVGWISGIHLDDMGKRAPMVRDGRQKGLLENAAVAFNMPLPENMSAEVSIVNLFEQGPGEEIQFASSSFEASACTVGGRPESLAKYLTRIGHDTRLPLVADYSGAKINVSIKAVDLENDRVEFYAPVFSRMAYKLAKPFSESYEKAFLKATESLPGQASFSCNCILNYLYSELEGKRTGAVTGPMTFGEVAYVLLNQTMVHLSLQEH